jgi:hypothetical protein
VIPLLCFLIMLPLIALPLGQDQLSFWYLGELLGRGHTLYFDAVDVMPPLIYLWNMVMAQLFATTLPMQCIDVVLHSAIAWYVYVLCKKCGYSFRVAFVSAVTYALYYSLTSYGNAMQSETYANVFVVLLLFLCREHPTAAKACVAGIIVALLFLLKYTLGLSGVIVLVWLFRMRPLQIKALVLCAVGFLIPVGGVLLWMAVSGSLADFYEMFEFALAYSSGMKSTMWKLQNMGIQTAKFGYKWVTIFGLICASAVGVRFLSIPKRSLEWYCVVAVVVLGLSALMEQKYFVYHWYRALVPYVILFSIGLFRIYDSLRFIYFRKNPRLAVGLLVLAFVTLGLGPRIVVTTYRHAVALTSKMEYLKFHGSHGVSRGVGSVEIIEKLRSIVLPTDTVAVMSLNAIEVSQFFPHAYRGPFADVHFYTASNVSRQKQQLYRKFLRSCDVIVVDTCDENSMLTLRSGTSMQIFRGDTAIFPWFQQNFVQVASAATCLIYQRKQLSI